MKVTIINEPTMEASGKLSLALFDEVFIAPYYHAIFYEKLQSVKLKTIL